MNLLEELFALAETGLNNAYASGEQAKMEAIESNDSYWILKKLSSESSVIKRQGYSLALQTLLKDAPVYKLSELYRDVFSKRNVYGCMALKTIVEAYNITIKDENGTQIALAICVQKKFHRLA